MPSTICALNDTFRRTLVGGRVCMSSGIASLPDATRAQILKKVRAFSEFTEENDPYGQHDFGVVDLAEHRVFWKIDYYDAQCECGSEDPANPDVTTRVLTIFFADEY